MKKQTLLLLILLTTFAFRSLGQITYEHTFYRPPTEFFYTDLGNNDFKYVFEDTTGFKLYDPNYNLSMQVVTPIPLWTPPSYYLVAYITKSLFDCDSSNIEYVITSPTYLGNFYIYRTDGTLLFQKDSVTGPYGTTNADGSIWTKPIFKTPTGTKLWLVQNCCTQDSLWVYGLCGELPTIVQDNMLNESFVKVFPNPTSRIINFQITPPNNQEKFKLTIYSSSFQVVDEKNLTERNYQIDLNSHPLSAGTYLFDLRADNKIFQTGKFIITR